MIQSTRFITVPTFQSFPPSSPSSLPRVSKRPIRFQSEAPSARPRLSAALSRSVASASRPRATCCCCGGGDALQPLPQHAHLLPSPVTAA